MQLPAADLDRFHSAQGAGSPSAYNRALAELRSGRKHSHWIWFVLPQLQGLGRSAMAQRYDIAGLEEAQSYLGHPTLRGHLDEVIAVIANQLQQPGQSLERLMGGQLDSAKTVSSLTLFAAAGLASGHELLNQLGRRCELTCELLRTAP